MKHVPFLSVGAKSVLFCLLCSCQAVVFVAKVAGAFEVEIFIHHVGLTYRERSEIEFH